MRISSLRRPLGAFALAAVVTSTAACGPDATAAASKTRPTPVAVQPTPVAPAPVVVPAPQPPAPVETVEPAPAAPAAPAPRAAAAAGYPFGEASLWRADLTGAPLAPNSAGLVSWLADSVTSRYGGVAALNVTQYNNSFYVAEPGTPTVDVGFNDCQGKGHVPDGLLGPGGQFSGVPIPAGAVPANGDDKAMSVYSPATDQLWEFWVAEPSGDGGWTACWGGRIDDVSTSPGFFHGSYGSSASGLSITGGMVGLADVRAGAIEHAIGLAVPEPAAALSWPAQRTDGDNSDPNALPEGMRLRLDPSLDVDSLGLHPVAAMIAKAAQRYGFIVTDHAGAVAVATESGAAEAAVTGTDPWDAILAGTPEFEVLENFPWTSLQALPMDYGKP